MRSRFQNNDPHRSGSQKLLLNLVLVLLLAGTTGCTVSQIAARRIAAAPNRFPSSLNEKIEKAWRWENFEKLFLPDEADPGFLHATIPVGPPVAKLSVIVLPPRNYHAKVVSNTSTSADGKTNSLSLQVLTEPNNTFHPLETPATVVLLHGYSMTKESMAHWAIVLAQAGYRVVLVDLRGHGRSTGRHISFGKHETTDLSRMLDYLMAKNLCDEQVGVLGLSYGGTLALHWAAHDWRVRTVVAIAPYNRPDEAMRAFASEATLPVSEKTVEKAISLVAKKHDLDWTHWSGEAAASQLRQSALFIGGADDSICRPQDVEQLKQAAPAGSKHIEVPGANHLAIGYWLHDLTEPVIAWFHEHLASSPLAERSLQQLPGN